MYIGAYLRMYVFTLSRLPDLILLLLLLLLLLCVSIGTLYTVSIAILKFDGK